ncbi:MAG: hypothetical protein RL375_751 [Pseudomonadota bacterium]|jgi:hypothetical protein
MVQTLKPLDNGLATYVVLRAICIGGDRVEPGASIQLTKVQGTELAAAAKVAADGTPAAKAAQDAAKAAAKAAKAAAAAKPAEKPADPIPETATTSQEGPAS